MFEFAGLTAIEADDVGEEFELGGGEIPVGAVELAEDVAGVEEQDGISVAGPLVILIVILLGTVTLTPGPSPRGRREFIGDLGQHIGCIVEDLLVFETDNRVTEGTEVGIPFFVCLYPVRLIVDRTIQFHNESAFRTKEIYDVVADLVLTTEFQIRQLPIPK